MLIILTNNKVCLHSFRNARCLWENVSCPDSLSSLSRCQRWRLDRKLHTSSLLAPKLWPVSDSLADVLIGLETALRFNQRGLGTLNFIATFPLVFFLSADVEGKEMQRISAAQWRDEGLGQKWLQPINIPLSKTSKSNPMKWRQGFAFIVNSRTDAWLSR